MALSVYESVPIESQGPVHVLAWRVLGQFGFTGRDVAHTRRRRRRVLGLVAGREVKVGGGVDKRLVGAGDAGEVGSG